LTFGRCDVSRERLSTLKAVCNAQITNSPFLRGRDDVAS
jgi:hypothetical protein